MTSLSRPSVLISGGNGYIGSHLAATLAKQGHEVHMLHRPTSEFHYLKAELENCVKWEFHNYTDLPSIVRETGCEVCVHLAANTEQEADATSVDRILEANLSFGVHLVRAVKDANCQAFINTGTFWQFAQDGTPQPNSLYAAAKDAFQSVLRYYFAAGSLSVANLILYEVYGNKDRRRKVLDLFFEAAKSKTPLALSPGEQVMDFVHVEDVVDAYVECIMRQRTTSTHHFQTFHIRNERHRLREVADLFEKAGLTVDCRWGALPYRGNQIMVPPKGPVLDGWHPKWSVLDWIRAKKNEEDGLRDR